MSFLYILKLIDKNEDYSFEYNGPSLTFDEII